MKKQIVLDDENVEVDVLEETPSFVLFKFDGEEYTVNLNSKDQGTMVLGLKGKNRAVSFADSHYVVDGKEFSVALPRRSRVKGKTSDVGSMTSPMPGKILKILAKVGDAVTVGTPILVMEAMKMEHTIKAAKDGKIEKIHFKEGEQVAGGVELVSIC